MAKRNKQEEQVRQVLEEKQEEDRVRAADDSAPEDSPQDQPARDHAAQDDPDRDELDPSVESVRRAAAERR
jgi:hypothetical protein